MRRLAYANTSTNINSPKTITKDFRELVGAGLSLMLVDVIEEDAQLHLTM